MTNADKYGNRLPTAAERYGKHSQANATGQSATQLIQQAIAAGNAIRLAWRNDQSAGRADDSLEFPTAVLPAITDTETPGEGTDDDTKPTTTAGQARQRATPDDFSWWPIRLAG